MNRNSTLALAAQQSVCIDLPGETVRCWRSTDKVQVILRKHRDVIFDLKSSSERKYTVESTGSDFYHADKKKLIAGGGRQRVLFNDGERLHLWISREFKGYLLLKSDGKLLMRIAPEDLDAKEYGGLPSSKPDPIVVSIGELVQDSPAHKERPLVKLHGRKPHEPRPHSFPAAAPVDSEDHPLVCVIDGDIKGAPKAVIEAIDRGGGKPGPRDLDLGDVATRDWILGQLVGSVGYVSDNWSWLRESIDDKTRKGFKLVSAKIHYVRGQARFYFSGYSKHNKFFGPGGFGSGHERVMTIFAGAGDVTTVIKSTAKGVFDAFKGYALISFVFGNVTSFLEWRADASKDGYDLFASVIMNAVKTVLVAVIVAPVVAGIAGAIVFGSEAGVAVIAVGALCLGFGVIASFGVEAVDKKLGKIIGGGKNNGGLSEILAEKMRQNVKGNWDYLKKKLLWDYAEIPF